METNPGLSEQKQSPFPNTVVRTFGWFVAIWLSWKVWIYIVGVESQPIAQRHWPALSRQWENINDWLRHLLLACCKQVLSLAGYNAQVSGHYLWLEDIRSAGSLAVGDYCLGFQLMFYHIALTFIAPVKWSRKLLYALGGLIFIQLFNVSRLVGLMLVKVYLPSQLWLAHDYVFVIPVLLVLLYFNFRINRSAT